MKLPNGHRAIVDEKKLRNYCLSPEHSRGRNKARLFAAAIGLTKADTKKLREALLKAAVESEATPAAQNGFGQLYEVRFEMTGPHGSKTVLSAWIIEKTNDIPRLVTCYPV
jgi:uncharacterized protein DUF6883